ncbi:YheT family hydrolase [Rubritalea halochordaticola]
MPLVERSAYQSPWWMPGGHLQTILPAVLRRPRLVTRERERLELEDGDFLDLDWRREGRGRLAILSHGLESSSKVMYIQAMAEALWQAGWDVLAWNFRSCSGEMNRLMRFYHSGVSDDLKRVLDHALATHPAKQVDLVGFSLGGNITLKLLGELGEELPPQLHRAVTFSVPCDLSCSSKSLESWWNRKLYMRRFLRSLMEKVEHKRELHPELPEHDAGLRLETFQQFDDTYTAPLHGFRDAREYWERCSSRPFIENIRIPTLLVQAANDPFLGERCYPYEEARRSEHFYLEVTRQGGHVGFGSPWQRQNWAEARVLEFLNA